MLKNLDNLGFTSMLQVQQEAIPHILEKKDVLARAKTGSGKTVAFGLPLLLNLDITERYKISALILTPTRELASQVSNELRKLARFQENIKILTLCGGTPLRAQANSLKHGAHIVVGTPGRILDHIDKQTLDITAVRTLVLDEADRMLDMGFYPDIQKIIEKTPQHRQTLLFSATFDDGIKNLSQEIQNNRIEIELETLNTIEEIFFDANSFNKDDLLLSVISTYQPNSCIIFANTKIKTQELEDMLLNLGYDAICINSDLEQIDRDENLIKFSNASATFLIATDVAARGLDIKNVELVINYDEPHDDEVYTHRIGRTGRNNTQGTAITFSHRKSRDCAETSLHVKKKPYSAPMQTLCISGGKKQKLRAGDIVGTLIQQLGFQKEDIGVINVTDFYSYAAIEKKSLKKVKDNLKECTIKKKRFRMWII
jgi:ATP-independent RNA helicase DbpA